MVRGIPAVWWPLTKHLHGTAVFAAQLWLHNPGSVPFCRLGSEICITKENYLPFILLQELDMIVPHVTDNKDLEKTSSFSKTILARI